MSEIINLRQARKRRARAAREIEANANRLKFGRTKAQRHSDEAQRERAHSSLAGHELEKRKD
mgnify:CR=1 FL=1